MTQKRHRAYIAEARKLGASVEGLQPTGGTHMWLVLTALGKRQGFLIANSDSDRRAFLNWRARVKRWMKELHHAPQDDLARPRSKPH